MDPSVKQIELEILVRCLRLEADFSAPAGLEPALPPGIDWPALKKAALAHGVFPSFYRWLADSCPEATPPEVLSEWRRLYKIHARKNLEKTAELLQVLNFLESHDIPAAPLKGPVLAAMAYGDITLRQFVDLDILVSRKDIGKVRDLLLTQGYRSRYSLTEKQERLHLKYAVEFTFDHPRRTILDVHWRFAADFLGDGLEPEEVIIRRVPVKVLGKTVYTLHPEDNLLMLCQHGNFHSWSTLSTVSDLAHLIHSQNSWNWSGVLLRAKESGLRRQTLLGLSLAQELLGAQVPPEVIEEAEADASVVAVRRWVCKDILMRRGANLGFLEQTAFYLQTRDSFQDKVRHVWCRLAIPTVEDWRWAPLPDSLYGLYFVIRPLRLVFQGLIMPAWYRLR